MKLLSTLLCLAVLALGLAACESPPKTTSPLSPPAEVPGDARLAGAWYGTENGGSGMVYVLVTADEAATAFEVLGLITEDGPGDNAVAWVAGTAHASRLDGQTYYNLRITQNADDGPEVTEPPYIVMRTHIAAEGSLTLEFMSHRLLDRLIEEKRLPGRLVDGAYDGQKAEFLLIDISSAALATLIRGTTPDKLFTLTYGPLYRLPKTPEKPEIRDRGEEG